MNRLRRLIQVLFTLLTNAYLLFPWGPVIYQGPLKGICHPGLNCYSCPAALFGCPVGAFQNFMANIRLSLATGVPQMGTIVVGYLGFIGSLVGRFPCAWLCPFGLIQDLLYKIPGPKLNIPGPLKYVKYVILVLLVVILPLFWVDPTGLGTPWFCKLICPAGTLLGAFPLLVVKPSLWQALSFYFWNKVILLVLFIGWSIVSSRAFCRVLCPLGAFYGLFNRYSLFRLNYDEDKCVHCLACYRQCPMGVRPYQYADDTNCIRCLKCVQACRFGALSFNLRKLPAAPARAIQQRET
ncbi:MAG: 4Fe-4S binding protein [Deltaproteobacteria bacterium]|nr:4Fe-4S binding protein [Deltaproteobacteria bacterium]MBW1952145.1 4Fe-4S binding protein [Deltaproteobacteria bacterium]MBW1986166.1 4Fe-4S binding protein [Deltaproteobacteria bacterium]MBW2134920.1 4Fe-4S binding protein [Deltaproteobacteria bacterium]